MKCSIAITMLLIGSAAFASGPDETTHEVISANERLEQLQTSSLGCTTWTQSDGSVLAKATLQLSHLGNRKESIVLHSGILLSCQLADEVKSVPQIEVKVSQTLYLETPIDLSTGQPSGEPSYYSCTTSFTFANSLRLNAWYWLPQDPSACK